MVDKSLHISLYKTSPWPLHLYVLIFVPMYPIIGYLAFVKFAEETSPIEGGLFAAFSFPATLFLQILCWLGTHWSIGFNCFATMKRVDSIERANVARVTPSNSHSQPSLCQILKKNEQGVAVIPFFEYQQRKFIFDEKTKTFQKPILFKEEAASFFLRQTGLSQAEAQSRLLIWGKNQFDIPMRTFRDLYKEHATAPFFVFQIFCVLLWCLDEMWYYSVFTFFMLLLFEATIVKSRMKNLEQLRQMASKPSNVLVYRDGNWTSTSSENVVPGDIISLVRSKNEEVVVCDAVILHGTCVVNEAILTGESIPQQKRAVSECQESDIISLHRNTTDRGHIVYSGSTIVQHTSAGKTHIGAPRNGGCVALVTSTGFNTTQGSLLRTILFSSQRASANTWESFVFILVLLFFAVIAAGYVAVKGLQDPNRSRYKLLLNCTMLITMVVPPELPMELALAVNTSLIALQKLGIFCTEPFRIPFAGKATICCFDKTGTITSDDLQLQGIAGTRHHELTSIQDSDVMTPPILAACHTLSKSDDDIIGDPMERCAMLALPWNLSGSEVVCERVGKKRTIRKVQTFPFSSKLGRMSIIAQIDEHNTTRFFVLAKGAPDVMEGLLSNVPDNYQDEYKHFAQQGSRVITLAFKQLESSTVTKLKTMTREAAESDLTFAGMAVFQCPLKRDSVKSVASLKRSNHHVVMITGDHRLTACHVAKQLSMGVHEDYLMLVVDGHTGALSWVNPRETIKELFTQDAKVQQLSKKYDLCLSGDSLLALEKVCSRATVLSIITHTKVFARMSPDQKEEILAAFRDCGHVTLMCGDGTNDVGALKMANVGVALLKSAAATEQAPTASKKQLTFAERLAQAQEEENSSSAAVVRLGDASIAAPFTSKSPYISSCCHILRQGRCTLVVTLQIYKILALNCLVNAFSLSVLQSEGVKFADTQMTMTGLIVAIMFLFISKATPKPELSEHHPPASIFNVYFVLSVVLQFCVHLGAVFFMIEKADLFKHRIASDLDADGKFRVSPLNTVIYLLSTSMQLCTFTVNYQGHPFMESMREHKPLLYLAVGAMVYLLVATTEISPAINETLELASLSLHEKFLTIATMMADLVLAFVMEKLCSFFFYRWARTTKTDTLIKECSK